MTNGEKLEEVFPKGLFLYKEGWLNEEYKEPTTKMQIVIDISEEDYKRGTVLASAIRSGIPLPKGHGR